MEELLYVVFFGGGVDGSKGGNTLLILPFILLSFKWVQNVFLF